MKTLASVAVFFLSLLTSAHAQDAPIDPWTRVINMQTAGNWAVSPDRPRAQLVPVTGQSFTNALRVRARAGANPWDVVASSPAGATIDEGATILVMLLAREETPAEGGSVLPMYVQLSSAPYTSVAGGEFQLTSEWKTFCASGVAAQPLPNGAANVTLHLGRADQVIDLGPVFVFNFGPDFDPARLPACPG